MTINSIPFAIFICSLIFILLISQKVSVSNKFRNIVLLLFSLIFYLLIDIKFFILMFIVAIYTFYFGKHVKNSKVTLILHICLSVGILLVFKYLGFFVSEFSKLFNINSSGLNIVLPIGLSFYIFKSISYVADIYKGKYDDNSSFIEVVLYISYFPEIVSGPISRPQILLDQIKNDRKIEAKSFSDGLQIYFIGLFKKIVIADNISVFVNEIYRAPNIYSSLSVWICIFAYSIQIYMDFSGYSDMSIGISKMLGFDIEKNFNLPYISRNVTEFWSRWHISLSSWLKNYIYIPLGGNRKGNGRQYLNLLITMILCGIWHGGKINFILWGFVNGLALVIHKIFSKSSKKESSILSMVVTFIFISFSWILFRSTDLNNALNIINRLFSFNGGVKYIGMWSVMGFIIMFITHMFQKIKNKGESYYYLQDLTTIKGLFIFFVFVGLTFGLAYTGFSPFIYSAF